MGPGFLPTFLYYFVGTTLIVAFVVSQGAINVEVSNPVQVGLPFGLLAGLLGSYFNRSQTVAVTFKSKKVFTRSLNELLGQLGYQETSPVDEFIVYERSIPSKWLSSKLFVQIGNESATLTGRSSIVRALQKQLSGRDSAES